MTDSQVIAALTGQQTLALTMWAEARQTPRDRSPVEELLAVGCVIRNRLAHPARWAATDGTYKGICLAPRQFSCWNSDTSANHLALMTQARVLVDRDASAVLLVKPDPEVRECLFLALGVINGEVIDRTGGANSYFAPTAMIPAGKVPVWAIGKSFVTIGDQRFIGV